MDLLADFDFAALADEIGRRKLMFADGDPANPGMMVLLSHQEHAAVITALLVEGTLRAHEP